MIYIVSAVTAALLTGFFFLYMKKTGYFPMKENAAVRAAESSETEFPPVYGKRQSLIFTALFFLMAAVTNYFIYNYSYLMNEYNISAQPLIFPKMAVTHMLCACAALTDFKRCKIPNKLIITGLIARAVMYIIEFILAREYFGDIIINDLLGFGIGFIMLFVIAVITKGGIGFGDVKLFGIIGLMAGSGGVFTTLFLSLFMSSIGSIILMIAKKKTLKSSVPMAPFIYGGFAVMVILGIF